jgi:crotonobetainyl-CoA:carnitine CoA-transferase CaiB-like acyl-CoA transferase
MATKVTHPELGELSLVASPVNHEGVAKTIRTATPSAGEHTDEIMTSLGYTAEQIADYRSKGVIG